MRKKIVLINPPVSIYVNKTAFAPLPLLVLGTCLKKIQEEGLDFSYEVVDLDFLLKQGKFSDDHRFYKQAGDLLLEKKPDIFMFTVHGLNHIIVLKLSEIIKNNRPSTIIIAGGVGPTLKAREALERCPSIDIIVKGEGEPILKYLIPAIFNQERLSDIPSIVYREGGQVLENKRRFLSQEEPIPFPDYSLICIEDYLQHNKTNPYVHPGFVLIESGRGCPFACSFCAPAKMWGSTVRYRPISHIIEEMKFLAGKGGNFSFFTQDNLEEKFLIALAKALIDEQVNIKWGCYSRLDRLSEGAAGLLSQAGCRLIFTGPETPNQSAQKSIKKVINPSSAFDMMQRFNAQGIQLIASFIAGFEDESEDELDRTMGYALEWAAGKQSEMIYQLIDQTDQQKLPPKGPNICLIHPLSYMPGTEAFEKEKDHLHIDKYSLHPDCYGSQLFSYDEFKQDWSFLGGNPYVNHLPEEKVRFYCSILRLFNLLNSRPYYLALLLRIMDRGPLGAMKKMVADLGEEFVLTAKIEAFETETRKYLGKHLKFNPEWTVKKGQ
jgi:radical SAM superfamily enzyme YgiQ (UPF0313 family)